jgi:hypothetical protein
MNNRDRLKYTKTASAYHEAGHFVTARHFGISVQAWLHIEKIDRPDGSTFKLWTGQCDTMGAGGLLSNHQERVHSVAGAIAQLTWDAGRHEDGAMPDWSTILDYMSPSDCTLKGVQLDLASVNDNEWRKWWKAMDEAHAMLNRATGPLWPTVQRVARRLLTSERNYVGLNRRESNAAHRRLAAHWAAS